LAAGCAAGASFLGSASRALGDGFAAVFRSGAAFSVAGFAAAGFSGARFAVSGRGAALLLAAGRLAARFSAGWLAGALAAVRPSAA
jgi:hypothetical protein